MSRIASTIAACLLLAKAGTASAAATQDFRSADARVASPSQDYRSPDSRPLGVAQDYRSPDAAGAPVGQEFGSFSDLRPIADRRTTSASGFDWGYLAAGIALTLIALASVAYTTRRRRTVTAA